MRSKVTWKLLTVFSFLFFSFLSLLSLLLCFSPAPFSLPSRGIILFVFVLLCSNVINLVLRVVGQQLRSTVEDQAESFVSVLEDMEK